MRRFEGLIRKDVVPVNIVRIERVKGAATVTHVDEENHSLSPVKYAIAQDMIVRPDRDAAHQFLVAGIGDLLSFESEDTHVFVSGICAADEGPTVDAGECFGCRKSDGYIHTGKGSHQ
jgi:hypothetical protein